MKIFDSADYETFTPVFTTDSMRVLDATAKSAGESGATTNVSDSDANIKRGYSLMKEAGLALFNLVKNRSPKRVAIFVGCGNNGGDGLVLARLLLEFGIPFAVFSLADESKFRNEAKMALDEFVKNRGTLLKLQQRVTQDTVQGSSQDAVQGTDKNTVQEIPRLDGFDLIVDCMLGNGARGELRSNIASAVKAICDSKVPVIAADAPTGYDSAAHKQTSLCIHADETLLFGFPRIDAYVKEGGEVFGNVITAPLSYPKELVAKFDSKLYLAGENCIPQLLPKRSEWGDKRDQGTAMIIAGSRDMTGAAALCTEAALRSGAGLITLASPQEIIPVLQTKLSEPVFCRLDDDNKGILMPGNVPVLLQKTAYNNAIAIGPGLGTNNATREAVLEFLSKVDNRPVVIDADALNAIAMEPTILQAITVPAILTPHVREYERLFGKLPENAVDIPDVLREIAQKTNKIILLKGAPTFIAVPNGRVFLLPVANSGMAKGGSGDVLTGIIVALLSQGLPIEDAAVLGAVLHQKAGRIARDRLGCYSMIPSDIIANLYKSFEA